MKKSTKYIIMSFFGVSAIGVAVAVTFLIIEGNAQKEVTFDEKFLFGAASASYQIEGAWDADGKTPNVWDEVTHRDWGYTADRSNGDVAANSYEYYEKDIEALQNIGVSGLYIRNLIQMFTRSLMTNLLPLNT